MDRDTEEYGHGKIRQLVQMLAQAKMRSVLRDMSMNSFQDKSNISAMESNARFSSTFLGTNLEATNLEAIIHALKISV